VSQRLDVGVDDRRGGSLVFADLRRNLMGGGRVEVGLPGSEHGQSLALVARVRVSVQEHHGDRRHAGAR
jgi:hypothetical protein